MNPLDWILIVVLGSSVVRALMRGFVREVFALGGLVVGLVLASWLYSPLALELQGLIARPVLAQTIAFVAIVLGSVLAANLIARVLSHTASVVGLRLVDRLLGGLFGLCRGAILCMVLLLLMTAFLPSPPLVDNSHLSPYFLQADHAVSFVMPPELNRRLLDELDRLKHGTPDWIK